MRLGVIDGPGHHGSLMIEQLAAHEHEVVHTHAHPKFSALNSRCGAVARRTDSLVHDAVRRITSAAQYRLRKWGGLSTSYDFDLYSRAYSKIAARYFDEADALIGFSFVSYDAHKRARERGRPCILELPSAHILAHLELVTEEYQRAGQTPSREGIVFSRFAIERACQEYNQADLINVLSSFAKQTLASHGVISDKVIVSPLGIDAKLFCPKEGSAMSRPFRVLFVGRIELAKGVRYLLEAFGRLRLPNAELWLIGSVFDEALPFLKAYPEGVTLHQPMPHNKLVDCYRQCDVFVFPTISDGLGLVMLEAMSCGLPVIATDHSGAPDVIREGTDGFIVSIRDAEALSKHILWLYQNEEARVIMGRNARERIETMFTKEHYGERLQGIIASVGGLSDRG